MGYTRFSFTWKEHRISERERYIIRFSRPGSTEDEQIEVDGFAIWREDAGFRSEHLLIDEGRDLEAAWFGPWRVYADEKGITSIARLNITEPDEDGA